jgi:hypothetical protein
MSCLPGTLSGAMGLAEGEEICRSPPPSSLIYALTAGGIGAF